MATAPTIRSAIVWLASRSAPAARFRHRLARTRQARAGSIAWHQLAAASWRLGMRLLYGVRYTDMCAFPGHPPRRRCWRSDMRELTYGWNIEMQMRAARAGLRILEIPVDYRRRSGGTQRSRELSGTVRPAAHHRDVRSRCDRGRRREQRRRRTRSAAPSSKRP
jgi:hypothetical protein